MTTLQMSHNFVKSMIGKTAQSRILTMISDNGNKTFESAQPITGYEVVKHFGDYVVMFTIGGNSVFEDTLFNIN